MTHLIEIYNISGAKVIDKEDGTTARMEASECGVGFYIRQYNGLL